MPPRRANRHQNVEALYRREEADQMEQRMHEKIDEGIGRLEKLMIDMNQSRRRNSPESIRGGSRVSHHSDRARRESQDHQSVDNRSRRNVDDHDRRDVGSRSGGRDVGGRERQRYT